MNRRKRLKQMINIFQQLALWNRLLTQDDSVVL